MNRFVLKAPYPPSGDQPAAIESLARGVLEGKRDQVLLGVTGSGKTFTMASVIEKVQKPTLVLAHNKTLAAQLCSELRAFFPDSAVEYFVSYYDYYQPEAYIASTDTYIEKDASINEEIDRLRHSATAAVRERSDVIIVASVSCIYSMGDPSEYEGMMVSMRPGMQISRNKLIERLVEIQYTRNDYEFTRGSFRVHGDVLEIIPANEREHALRIEFFGDEIDRIREIEVVSGNVLSTLEHAVVFPATHYAMDREKMNENIDQIERDLEVRAKELEDEGQPLYAMRLRQRTRYDIEMMRQIGFCTGIENYSRYFDGRKPGDAPYSLLDYFPKDFLMFIDESHVTVPQIRAMYNGDRARKKSLVDYGFRLPSAYDNRPLLFEEFRARQNQTIYVSATPAAYELGLSENTVEQIIRPTGLIDPLIVLRPATGQVDDLVGEIHRTTEKGGRVLVTTLTKRMAESLTDYLKNLGIRVRYLHSDIQTMERTQLIRDLRLGEFDVLVGINLLREGLDMPEGQPCGDFGRGQGGLSAQRNLAHPDHRPRGAQCGRPRHPLRRRAHREHGARHERNQPPPRAAGGVQQAPRHHAAERQEHRAGPHPHHRQHEGPQARRHERRGASGTDEERGGPDALRRQGPRFRARRQAARRAVPLKGRKARRHSKAAGA